MQKRIFIIIERMIIGNHTTELCYEYINTVGKQLYVVHVMTKMILISIFLLQFVHLEYYLDVL